MDVFSPLEVKFWKGKAQSNKSVQGFLAKLNCGEKHFQCNSQDIWTLPPFSSAWQPTYHGSVKKYLATVSRKFRPLSGALIPVTLKRVEGQAAFGGVGEGVDKGELGTSEFSALWKSLGALLLLLRNVILFSSP